MRTLSTLSLFLMLSVSLAACGDDDPSNGGNSGDQDSGTNDSGSSDDGGANDDSGSGGGDGGSDDGGGNDGGDPDPIVCEAPEELCGDLCIDTTIDPENCGACEDPCGGEEFCARGECTAECPNGTEECVAGSRACNDLREDRANCGGCGDGCEDTEICANGNCVACSEQQSRCGNDCTNVQIDSENCGECGHVCPEGFQCNGGSCFGPPSACDPACTLPEVCSEEGTCVSPFSCPGGCPEGEVCRNGECAADCGQNLTECGGECVVVNFDTRHCGECDNPCADGEFCLNGNCQGFGGNGGGSDGGFTFPDGGFIGL